MDASLMGVSCHIGAAHHADDDDDDDDMLMEWETQANLETKHIMTDLNVTMCYLDLLSEAYVID